MTESNLPPSGTSSIEPHGPISDMGTGSPEFLALLSDLDARFPRPGSSLATMYQGAIAALRDGTNPDRLALSAHEMREVIEKGAECFGIKRAPAGMLKEKLTALKRRYVAACAGGSAPVLDSAAGKAFVKDMSGLDKWLREFSPTVTERYRRTVRELNVASEALPGDIEGEMVAALDRLDGYFKNVAHHTQATTDAEMRDGMGTLEALWLALARPRTSTKRNELGQMIRDAEGAADANA